MGVEIYKDEEGKEHYIFDNSELYDDDNIGEKLEDIEILRIHNDNTIKTVHSLINQKIYSMKTINYKKGNFGLKYKESLIKQIDNILKLNYFYILKFYKYFVTDNEIHIIMEHTNNGSLNDFIKIHASLKLNISEEYLWNLFIQCTKALRFLHSNDIIHMSINPRHFLMTNEKIIKLELCPKKDEFESYEIPEKEFSKKGDVYSLGCVFYQLVFLVQNLKDYNFPKLNEESYYSDELIDIIKSMIEKNPEKRPSSEELCNRIMQEYDNIITKNSSISALISCLNSISKIEKEFNLNKSKFNDKKLTPISCSFFNCLKNINDKNEWNRAIKSFRRYFGTKNPRLDGDKEIDPFYLIIFLVENLHKELNEKSENNLEENQRYLIKRKEDKTNREDMTINFFSYFKGHFNSIISKTFFGIMKNKHTCKGCSLITFSFNNFCLLNFDVDKLAPYGDKKTIKLQNFFTGLKEGKFSTNSKNEYFCKGCSKKTPHLIEKKIYYMPHSLIICFRNSNKYYDADIDFPDFIDLSEEKEYTHSPGKFELKGFINKINDNGKENYIGYYKSPINEKIYSCENDIKEENSWNKNKGKVIMLFYEANNK